MSQAGTCNRGAPIPPIGPLAYVQVYNQSELNLNPGDLVTFDATGPIANFSHVNGSATVTCNADGLYLLQFLWGVFDAGSTAVLRNGVIVANLNFDIDQNTQQGAGSGLLVLAAGDTVELQYVGSFIGINVPAGTINATLTLTKVVTTGSTGSGLETIDANSGSANEVAGVINLLTDNSTVIFSGSGNTVTLDFGLDNLIIGADGVITSGISNVSLGLRALGSVTSGSGNIGIGEDALTNLVTGSANTAVGFEAGIDVTGLNNTIVGFGALSSASNANSNTVVGYLAMSNTTGGNNNVILGLSSGTAYTGTESNNVLLNNPGFLGESGSLRLGATGLGAGQQSRAFIAGTNGVTVANPASMVVIDTVTEQLGTQAIPLGVFVWSELNGSTTAQVNHGYFINSVGAMNLLLPPASAVGDQIKVIVISAGSTLVFTQAAGQQILLSTASTTLGAAGTLTNSNIGDSITLVCRTANLVWWAESFVGTWVTA